MSSKLYCSVQKISIGFGVSMSIGASFIVRVGFEVCCSSPHEEIEISGCYI